MDIPQNPDPGHGNEPAKSEPASLAPSASAAAPSNGDAHPPARRIKRRLMFSLIGLYGLAVLASVVLVLRGAGPRGEKYPTASGDKARGLLSMSDKEVVGWVSIHGAIMSSEGGRPWEKGVEQWSRRLRTMADTKGVKAIVLDINSPGGSVGAVQELHSQILRVRKEKKIPIVALFGDVAASGGYYIAAACDKIVAHPGTLTGSIGVIFSVSNMEGLFGKIGYKMEPIKSGKHKDIGSPARAMTAEERQLLQALIDDAYGQFVKAVAEGRKMTEEQVRPLADGRIYSGNQALNSKLVDQLGDSTDAIELAGELAGIKGRPKVRRDSEKIVDIFELLEARLHLSLGSSLAQAIAPHASAPRLEYRWSGF